MRHVTHIELDVQRPDEGATFACEVVGVVDDDPLLRQTLSANLEDAGFKVVVFDGGSALLRYVEDRRPLSVVLLDWAMPEMDGAQVLRRLRADGHVVPVICLTGYNQPVFEEAALAGGAVDFVDKGRNFSIILKRLHLALAGTKGGRPVTCANESGLHIDTTSARVYWNGSQVDLSLSEVKIVQLLASQAEKDVSYRAIYDRLRGEGFQAGSGEDGYRTNVRAIVKRIRQSFRETDPTFDAIRNCPGFGYRWSAAPGCG